MQVKPRQEVQNPPWEERLNWMTDLTGALSV